MLLCISMLLNVCTIVDLLDDPHADVGRCGKSIVWFCFPWISNGHSLDAWKRHGPFTKSDYANWMNKLMLLASLLNPNNSIFNWHLNWSNEQFLHVENVIIFPQIGSNNDFWCGKNSISPRWRCSVCISATRISE